MSNKIKLLSAAAAAAAMIAATPAASQVRYDPRYDPYYDDRRDDGFDIGTGIAVVGTIANILNAFRGGRGYGYGYGYPGAYGRPYGYNQGYARPYGSYGGYSYDYAAGVNAAVNSCGYEAQRFSGGGRVEIRDVDQVSNGRFRVRGVFDDLRNHNPYSNRRVDRDSFSCLTWSNGRIQDFDIDR
jgi:hypothetical protein